MKIVPPNEDQTENAVRVLVIVQFIGVLLGYPVHLLCASAATVLLMAAFYSTIGIIALVIYMIQSGWH